MYSVVPFDWHEQRQRNSRIWPPWSWDAALTMIQFFIWTGQWAGGKNGQFLPVQYWALLLSIFGILTVARHGKAALGRAVFVVLSMESCLWAGYWLGNRVKNLKPGQGRVWHVWALVVFVLLTLILLRHGVSAYDKIESKRRSQDRD